jgi:hypothetical protein
MRLTVPVLCIGCIFSNKIQNGSQPLIFLDLLHRKCYGGIQCRTCLRVRIWIQRVKPGKKSIPI